MVELNPINTVGGLDASSSPVDAVQALADAKTKVDIALKVPDVATRFDGAPKKDLEKSAAVVEKVVNSVSQDTMLSFTVEEELSRTVVAVRAVGSDEIIRQFPPEEFITVAKFIASQDPDMVNEDFLKGVLFDQYS